MKYILLSLTFVCIFSLSYGQSLERQVVSSAGSFISKSSVSLEYTIGETIVGNFKSSSAEFTQGFNQGSAKKNGVGISIIQENNVLEIYPNPSHDVLNVQSKVNGLVQITNSQGGKVLEGYSIIGSGTIQCDISSLSPGVYYVEFAYQNGQSSFTKFVKI